MSHSSSDNRGRLHPLGVYLRLKAEFRRLCAAVGSYEAAAALTRGSEATLHRHGDPVRDDLFAAVDMVLDLETSAGKPWVTAFLAEFQGYRLEPVAGRRPVTLDGPGIGVLMVMKEVGEFASAVHAMEADGERTITELDHAIREGQQAKEAIETSLDTLFRLRAEKMGAVGREG